MPHIWTWQSVKEEVKEEGEGREGEEGRIRKTEEGEVEEKDEEEEDEKAAT